MPINGNVVVLTALLAITTAALTSGSAAREANERPAAPSAAVCSRVASPDGSDVRRGTVNRPFRTAQRLVDALRPGQTGCLRAGTYSSSDDFVVRFTTRGRRGARIILRSYPGERATLHGNVEVMQGSDYVTLSRLHIEGTGGSNTVKVYAVGTIVERSDITNAWRGHSCMILGSDDYGVAVRPVVRRNRFHECGSFANDNEDHAIYAQSVVGGHIVRNVFWNSAAYAIQLYPNARHTRVTYNVIDGGAPSVRGGVVFGGDSSRASNDNVVERNVIAYAESYNIAASWDGVLGTGNVASRNCLWAGQDGNVDFSDGGFRARANVIADPAFRDRQAHDYRLGPASPCRRVIGSAGPGRGVSP